MQVNYASHLDSNRINLQRLLQSKKLAKGALHFRSLSIHFTLEVHKKNVFTLKCDKWTVQKLCQHQIVQELFIFFIHTG